MQIPHIDDWMFFDRLAHAQSLAEVAREWGVSPAAVSKRLSTLESRLGTQLMRRSTRSIALTVEGQRFADGAARVLREIREVEDAVHAESSLLRGTVSIHSTMGLGRTHIAPLVADLVTDNPNLKINLEMSEQPLNISGTGFDIAIRVGQNSDSQLLARTLFKQRRILCASPDYLEIHGAPKNPAELITHQCLVIRQDGNDYALWRFGDSTKNNETVIRVDGNLITNDGEVATRWCLNGHGIMLRSQWHAQPLIDSGQLVQVLPDLTTPDANITALYDPDMATNMRIQATLEFIQKGLKKRLPNLSQ